MLYFVEFDLQSIVNQKVQIQIFHDDAELKKYGTSAFSISL